MERGRKVPDRASVLTATVRAAVNEAGCLLDGRALFAGGKSMGGRMTSMEAGAHGLDVKGLVFFGFPLHPPRKPSVDRAEHLARVRLPMLFLQGTRDALADLQLINETCDRLSDRATLHEVGFADHSFGVPKRSGRTSAEVFEELADVFVAWARSHL